MDCIIVAVNYSILRKLRFDAWSKVTSKADYALLTLVNTLMNNMIFSSHATTARWEVVHIDRGFNKVKNVNPTIPTKIVKYLDFLNIYRNIFYNKFLQQIFLAFLLNVHILVSVGNIRHFNAMILKANQNEKIKCCFLYQN